jgi:hypothetical protein
MPWVMLGMLAAEAGKHYLVDQPQENAKRADMAAAQKYGPYINGFKGEGKADQYDPTQQNNLLAGLMQGGVGGMMMDQNLADHKLLNQYRQMQMDAMQKELSKGSGANDLTGADLASPATTSMISNDGSLGQVYPQGFDQRLMPDNPWSSMSDSFGADASMNPELWDMAGVGATA